MKSGIYKITNKVNGKVYIGSAVKLPNRKFEHFRLLKKGQHCNRHLQSAFNKYGEDNLGFEVLELCDPLKLIEREQHYIDTFQSHIDKKGYNICPKAGSALGVKHGAEVRKRMSEAKKGKESISGLNNYMTDKNKYLFVHPEFGQENTTIYELCKKYNLRTGSFSDLVKGKTSMNLGWYLGSVKVRVAHNERLDIKDADIIHDYQICQLSVKELSLKYDLSDVSVAVRLRRNDVTIRSNHEQKRLDRAKRYNYGQIRKDYEDGLGFKRISVLHGCDAMTIRDIIIEMKIPLRTMEQYRNRSSTRLCTSE